MTCKKINLRVALNAFSNNFKTQLAGHQNRTFHYRSILTIDRNSIDKSSVNCDIFNWEGLKNCKR